MLKYVVAYWLTQLVLHMQRGVLMLIFDLIIIVFVLGRNTWE